MCCHRDASAIANVSVTVSERKYGIDRAANAYGCAYANVRVLLNLIWTGIVTRMQSSARNGCVHQHHCSFDDIECDSLLPLQVMLVNA